MAAENPSQMETDDTVHDSQMRTHNESEFIGGDDAHYHGGNDPRGDSSDSDSQSESGHSEDDDDDEADDDDEDEDDDGAEEETEEEGEGE